MPRLYRVQGKYLPLEGGRPDLQTSNTLWRVKLFPGGFLGVASWPRVWGCYSCFAQPNDHMATQHHYLHTSWVSYKQPHSSAFVPAQYVDTHTYS